MGFKTSVFKSPRLYIRIDLKRLGGRSSASESFAGLFVHLDPQEGNTVRLSHPKILSTHHQSKWNTSVKDLTLRTICEFS